LNLIETLARLALIAQPAPKAPGLADMLMPFLLIGVIFYFLLLRPQQKQAKQAEAMRQGLKNGDEVATTGGILGRVKEVGDTWVVIESAGNTRIKVAKGHITQNLTQKSGAPEAAPAK
jgi:preprotein translocase subunit YajC